LDFINNKYPRPLYDQSKTLMTDVYYANKQYNQNNCILISTWDVIDVNTSAQTFYYKYDNVLTTMSNYVGYISDKYIHDNMTIPQILASNHCLNYVIKRPLTLPKTTTDSEPSTPKASAVYN